MKRILRSIAIVALSVFGLGASAQTALDFDGVDDHVLLPGLGAALDGDDTWTIELWVQDPDNSAYPFAINSTDYLLIHPAGTIVFYSTGGNIQSQNSTWIADGQPHHVAIRSNGPNTGQIFVDGVPVTMLSTGHTGFTGIAAEDFSIGSDYAATTQVIDDLRIWDVARSNAEITANYDQCLTGSEMGLIAFYDFEDGPGSSTLTDLTGNGYDGTLTNMDPLTDWVTGWNGCVRSCVVADQSLTHSPTSFICEGASTIQLASSEAGIGYFVRNNANDSAVTGPVTGTGSALNLSTGSVTSTTDFNVLGVKPTTIADGLSFDGVDDYGDCGNAQQFDITGDITLETWVNVNAYPSAAQWVRLVGKGGMADRTYGMWLYDNGLIRFQMYGSSNFDLDSPVGAISIGSWHHVAVTRTGTDMRIYIDGVQVASGTYTGTPASSTEPLTFGGEPIIHEVLDGSIDEVRVWNVGRTVTEISNNMGSCLTGTESGLVAYYPIEEGTGASTTLDFASSQHATLVGVDPATSWVSGATMCGFCMTEMSSIATVTIDPINDETVTAASATVCPNTGTTIDLGATQTGVNYFLRDDADNSIVTGPAAGSGSAESMNTGNIAATTTYNVLGTTSLGLDFDGTDDHVVLPNEANFDFTTSMTVEFWIKTTTLNLVDGLVTKGDDSWRIHGNGAGTVMFAGNGAFPDFNASTSLIDGTWHHVAAVYDGANASIYIDGNLENSVAATGAINNSAFQVALGENLQATGRNFEGQMDDVRIWSIALSQAELVDNMSSCFSGSESGLEAYYNFDDGSGSSTLSDLTGTNDGALTNMDPATDWVMGALACGCEFEMTATATVTVQDNAPTVATNPGNQAANVDAGTCGAVVTYTAPTFDDDCDGTGLAGTLTAGLASGSTFPVGTTTVEFTYTDGSSQTVTSSFDVVVTDNENPTITAPADVATNANDVNCSATGVTLGAPTTADNCNVASVTNDAPTTFPNGSTTVTWTVTDDAGNTATATQVVTVSTDLAGSATETPVDCNGNSTGAADLTATGGTTAYTYQWDDANNSTTEDLSGVPAGTYNVVITDANGCTANSSVTVTEPTALTVTVDGSTDPTACGASDGTASITASGGTVAGAYTYAWTDGGTFTDNNEDQTALAAGAYTVTVTDDNGCTATANVTLSDPNGPTVTTDSTLSVLALDCNGDTDGEIQVDVVLNGGATAATYLWDDANSTTTEDITGLGAGTYGLTVTDDNGCTASLTVDITEPAALAGSATSTDELLGNDGTIDLTVTGGTSPYTYSWTGPNGFTSAMEDPTGLEGGTYDVTVTDANGCTTTVQVVVASQVSVSEITKVNMKLYPNPSTGMFFVESNMTQGTVVIMDAAGREVARKAVNGSRTELDLSGKENGVYFVQLRTEDGSRTLRILLNK